MGYPSLLFHCPMFFVKGRMKKAGCRWPHPDGCTTFYFKDPGIVADLNVAPRAIFKNNELMRYFAFGSNMNPDRMRQRGVNYTSRVRAVLESYTLKFNKVSKNNPVKAFANIVPKEDGIVEGILYEMPAEDIKKIDRAEGAPKHYKRICVTVQLDDGSKVEADTYIAQPEWIREGIRPDREYLNHLLAGEDLLSKSYYRKLAETNTVD